MKKLLSDLNTQLQVLECTKGKSEAIVAEGNLEGVERHLNTLRSAIKRVEECIFVFLGHVGTMAIGRRRFDFGSVWNSSGFSARTKTIHYLCKRPT